jgi:hypothetical protein
MGQFKPMVKMMTTEPSVELKLKKGGAVKKADGGMMGMGAMPAAMPARGGMMAAKAPMRPPLAARRKAMAMPRKPMPSIMGSGVPAPASPMPAMKKGGKAEMESKATHKAEMSKMKGLEKELKSHESKPASKAHKGLKTGGVVMGQGGYKKGGMVKMADGGVPKSGIINTEGQGGKYRDTLMHTAEGEHHTPKKTGEVRMGNAGGYKKGGNIRKYAKGGGVEGNVSTTPAGVTNTTTGEVRKGNAGGYKKGGSAKKAYATGGLVDTGKPVAMPQGRKKPSAPVSINQLSGTFKKGGRVKMQAGGSVTDTYSKPDEDLSGGAYDRRYAEEKAENEAMRESILGAPKRAYESIKSMVKGMTRSEAPKTRSGASAPSVTKTEKSVTVTPAKKRGGAVKC